MYISIDKYLNFVEVRRTRIQQPSGGQTPTTETPRIADDYKASQTPRDQITEKLNYDRSLKECSFEPGDRVLLKEIKSQTGKFYMQLGGPFTIVEKISDLNYLIRRSTEHDKIG
ncbi:Uncharacterized protein APZ42_024391 [Daphnia magna]|uniref:Uncharacterized protein n=1 Tax=Daphnia magna TaxID=35525 RepID=A0A164U2P0_9CRUS|nr:Uncharacterized protein APZ42_024391 [Daphnia magna]